LQEADAVSQSFSSLHPEYIPDGFGLAARLHGINVGEFWGSEDQVAIHFRQRRTPHGWQITICWAPEQELMLTGTTGHEGAAVIVNGQEAIYHDGMWTPGPGPDQVSVGEDGSAHWGRDGVHSLTMHSDRGVFALRCPKQSVPGLDEMIKIMSSVPALARAESDV
jgi:hypothetical protein